MTEIVKPALLLWSVSGEMIPPPWVVETGGGPMNALKNRPAQVRCMLRSALGAPRREPHDGVVRPCR
jgi:hypothetical protein